jgi:hypothetical protein
MRDPLQKIFKLLLLHDRERAQQLPFVLLRLFCDGLELGLTRSRQGDPM